jgi:choline-sulfatase
MRPVVEAGPCVRSLQIDYDDEVEYQGTCRSCTTWRARREQQPFFLTVSYTHPHPPFVAPQRFWDLYRDQDIDPPRVPEIPYEQLDPHSQWLHVAHAQDLYTRHARRRCARAPCLLRHGQLRRREDRPRAGRAARDRPGRRHRGGALRRPRRDAGRARHVVQAVLLRRLGACAAGRGSARALRAAAVAARCRWSTCCPPSWTWPPTARRPTGSTPIDGHSLLPLVTGPMRRRPLRGLRVQLRRCLRRLAHGAPGAWKYIFTHGLPPMLFDLQADPDELREPGRRARLRGRRTAPARPAGAGLGPARGARAHPGQPAPAAVPGRRGMAGSGAIPNWAFQPFVDESQRFIRGSGAAGPTSVKARARFPYVEPVLPDGESMTRQATHCLPPSRPHLWRFP